MLSEVYTSGTLLRNHLLEAWKSPNPIMLSLFQAKNKKKCLTYPTHLPPTIPCHPLLQLLRSLQSLLASFRQPRSCSCGLPYHILTEHLPSNAEALAHVPEGGANGEERTCMGLRTLLPAEDGRFDPRKPIPSPSGFWRFCGVTRKPNSTHTHPKDMFLYQRQNTRASIPPSSKSNLADCFFFPCLSTCTAVGHVPVTRCAQSRTNERRQGSLLAMSFRY